MTLEFDYTKMSPLSDGIRNELSQMLTLNVTESNRVPGPLLNAVGDLIVIIFFRKLNIYLRN